MVQQIIGVDCSTQATKVGLAWAVRGDSAWKLKSVGTGGNGRSPAEIVSEWIVAGAGSTLLALDAPLGWPASLGQVLAGHRAGEALGKPANLLFRRETDRVVRQVTGKQSLDVGADRIARTAHWSLSFLSEVQERVGRPIPLAWDVPDLEGVRVIEVYPAATLCAHDVEIRGYKSVKNEELRSAVLRWLREQVDVASYGDELLEGADTLDAAVCVVAGLDFLNGRALSPPDRERAEVEGWIWFLDPRGWQ